MKRRFGFFSVCIILAVLSLTGTVAAETGTSNPAVGAAHFAPRPSDDLNVPAPLPNDGNWTRNWSGNMTRDRDQDGECDGIFGPDSPFYGLKLGFEDLDETFTFNETERIEKRIQHGDNRLQCREHGCIRGTDAGQSGQEGHHGDKRRDEHDEQDGQPACAAAGQVWTVGCH